MIYKNLERLKYTISKGNKPNATDIQALNEIIIYVNKEKERQIKHHYLFSKLFINVFKGYIIHFKGNYQEAVKWTKMILRIDFNTTIDRFTDEMNHIRLEQQIEMNKNIEDIDFIKWNSKQTKERLTELITDVIDDFNE